MNFKRKVFLIIFLITLFPFKVFAEQEIIPAEVEKKARDEINRTIKNELTMLDLRDMENTYQDYSDILNPIVDNKPIKVLISDLASGKVTLETENVLEIILKLFFDEISKILPMIVSILVIVALFSILNNLKPGTAETQVATAAVYVQYILVASISTSILISCFNLGLETIDNLSNFTQSVFPILSVLMVSIGGIVSASLFSPIVAFLTGFITLIVKTTFMPMIIILIVFTILDNISNKISLNNFSGLIKSILKWGVGIIFVVFLGVISIKGLVGSSFDGVSIKATKYTISKLVPYVGGMVSDTVDTVAACSLLLKNAVGISGLIIMFVIILKPIINIVGCSMLLKLSAAALEPISEKRVITLLDGFSDVLKHLMILIIVVGSMFFITICLLISSSNMNIMFR
jgi:stage III sporulation protein AE